MYSRLSRRIQVQPLFQTDLHPFCSPTEMPGATVGHDKLLNQTGTRSKVRVTV